MKSIAFRSEDLPAGFDDRARLSVWRDFLSEVYGPHDVTMLPGRRFTERLRGARFNHSPTPVDVLRFTGTVDRMSWMSHGQAGLNSPNFVLLINRGPRPLSLAQSGREVLLGAETAALFSCTKPGDLRFADPHDFSAIAIDQARLHQLSRPVEDFVARPLERSGGAMRHLRRYLDILPAADDIDDNSDLAVHVGTTIVDLVALALGAEKDAADEACMRGLRAARLHEIVTAIRTGFADPAFSPRGVARRMGVTDRYVQDLLRQSGSTFTERVLELRLQRARSMLADRRHDLMKIGEIASASGFSEIPYFNRCFRRRFGATPTEFRGAA